MKTKPTYDPVGQMRKDLVHWLGRPGAAPEQLADWLQGYGLPSIDHDDHTFLWLIKALPESQDRKHLRRRLARQAALLLERKPDLSPQGSQPDVLLNNLFLLCANLHCPDLLAEPLYQVYERQVRAPRRPRHFDLLCRDGLLEALIENQSDDRLREVWMKLARGGRHKLLPATWLDGYHGLVGALATDKPIRKTAIGLVGDGLTTVVSALERSHDRKNQFGKVIDDTMVRFDDSQELQKALMKQALRDAWPRWAVSKLPRQFLVESRGATNKTVNILSSVPMRPVVSAICEDYPPVAPQLDRQIVRSVMPSATAKRFERVAPEFTVNVRDVPYSSRTALLGCFLTTADVVHRRVSDPKTKEDMLRVHDCLRLAL